MNTISYQVPVVRKKQVLVVGGGCAGVPAAVCAARHGADTMLVDFNGYLGGTATAGMVGPFMTSFDPEGKRQVIKGFFDEFVRRMIKMDGAIGPEDCPPGSSHCGYRIPGHGNCTPFTVDAFKKTAEDMCREAGVELLYHAMFVSACMNPEGDRITGAVFATKAGLVQIDADIVIDCTGDADVAYRSEAPCLYGDEDGTTQPGSLFFSIRNVDKQKFEAVCEKTGNHDDIFYSAVLKEERAAGRFSVPRSRLGLYESSDGTFRVNMSRMFIRDACDPFEVTRAEIEGRDQMADIMALLRRAIPGCENAELVASASMLGVRESRRIQGDFVLRGEDIKACKQFEDNIFIAGNSVDMHGSGSSVRYEPAKGKAYGVPYRILLPSKVKNLLVAGRASSMDRVVLAAIRVMPPVFAMGQAAGTAAALALRENTSLSDIPVPELQKMLLADGVVLKECGCGERNGENTSSAVHEHGPVIEE